jgi:polyphosphate kinase
MTTTSGTGEVRTVDADQQAAGVATLPTRERAAAAAAAAAAPPEVPIGPQRYLNRHLSWLDYSSRVLAQAEDAAEPLLERAKFIAIFSSLVDEFFQVRVGGLVEQLHAGLSTVSADGMTTEEQLRAIRERVADLVATQMRIWREQLVPELDASGIRYSDYSALDAEDRGHLDTVFNDTIFPVLTPLAVDPAHPFPYISNLSLNLAVTVGEPDAATTRVARVKVPPLLPRFVVLPDGERFVPLEQVIAAHLDRLFPGMRILDHHPFRVTRNADYSLADDEGDDLLEAVEEVLKRRRRAPRVVRLEIDTGMDPAVLDLLLRELELEPAGVVTVDGPLDLNGVWALTKVDRPDLKAEPWTPVVPPALTGLGRGPDGAGHSIFDVLRRQDVIVHLPYESFAASVEALVEAAATDRDVLAIKQTLYRTDGDSPIVSALIRASEDGKQVVCLVELTARFDEAANIEWARQLEQAGVHVVYGMVGLKTHAKLCLVVRREGGVIRRYCHVGTGNYNAVTAKLYEDLGLLTSNADFGEDLTDLFNYLTGYSRQRDYRRLLVAPRTLRSGLLRLIRRETERGPAGRIVLKVNNLIDSEICEALYAASAAGARVDLIARSVCGVRPQVPGLSENIRVRSLTGRYLEHSRIYRFGPDGRADWYIGSADLMGRNLDGRVEAIGPVLEPSLQARLQEIIDIELADDTRAWELGSSGEWTKVARRTGVNAQRRMQELALARSGSTA